MREAVYQTDKEELPDIFDYKEDEENNFLVKEEERKEKDKTKRLENILSRLHSKISNSKGKSYDEIYKKYYFSEDDLLKREMIQNINKCKKVYFYLLIFYIGASSITSSFINISIKNSLYDLLITSGKVYYEI